MSDVLERVKKMVVEHLDAEEAGVILGSGIGGLQTTYDASILLHEKGPRRLSPFVIPSMLVNLSSGQVSMRHKLKGPNSAVATACATGAHAIGDAARIIACGDADMMVAGGGEASITRLGIGSFVACRAMTTGYNDTPEKASRPYDEGRDGFLMGERSGVVVLEDYDTAKARGAHASTVKMSSTKSATGHLLGAAGAIEAIFSILALRDKVAPPTLNLENPNVDTLVDLVPMKAKPFEGKAVMSNSFGFGGTNSALIFVEAE